ncbi:MAG: ParA family protein [Erythrobacter sp.]|jgi:cellulose biosynthesis protein BcsQ
MGVVAIYSVKGGVGKTTLATNLAWYAAQSSRRRTLLWDLDAAGGSAFLLGREPPRKQRALRLFSREIPAARLIRDTEFAKLDLLPSDSSLWDLSGHLVSLGKKHRLARIAKELGRSYSRIILDCPPVLSELSAQAMRAADLVIVPLPPSPLSSRALEMVADQARQMVRHHPPILPVFSMIDRRRALHREALEQHPDWPVIPLASAYEQCAVQRQPIGALAPGSLAARRIGDLWRAIDLKLAELKRA